MNASGIRSSDQPKLGNRSHVRRVLVTVAILGFVAVSAIPALATQYPSPAGSVVDEAHVLSASTRSALQGELDHDNRSASAQLAVVTVRTTAGETVEDYALHVFNQWGIGHRGSDDGVLLLVAADDHHVRIQTGRGL